MFYYAEINSEYQVVNKHCLSAESANPNYILISEDLYNNGNELGDIVGQFYNALLNVIEIVDPGWDMGQTCWMRYKDSQMRLSTKLDNMDKVTSLKADVDHTHEGYASSDDLQVLEDVVSTKADNSHMHSEYASVTHLHNEYSNVNHNHNSNYAPLAHTHTEYVTTADFNALEIEVDGKANASHGTHVSYSTTAPVMDGTASVGTASTVARSDHKHPTDTSRAAQTSLDSHTSNKSNPHGVTLAQLGVTATATELNYVDGVTSNIQTQLNGKASSGHTHSVVTTSANGLMSSSDKSKLDEMVLATVSEVETYLTI